MGERGVALKPKRAQETKQGLGGAPPHAKQLRLELLTHLFSLEFGSTVVTQDERHQTFRDLRYPAEKSSRRAL